MPGTKDKVIVVTGASSGIGEATALLLAKRGAKVVLGARRSDRLAALANRIVGAGGEAAYELVEEPSYRRRAARSRRQRRTSTRPSRSR